jgi:hypothetical protein
MPLKISASGLKAYLQCKRRYLLESVVRAPRDVPSYVTGGLGLDQAVNDYLLPPPPGGNGGQLALPFPEHAELAVLKPLLPEPGSVMVQPELRTPAPTSWAGDDVVVYGKLDALTPPSFEKMVIIDLKRIYTRSACLTETTLLDDIQAQLYAWLVWRTYLPARVFGRWVYYVRDTKRAHAVDVEFDRGRVEDWVARVVAPAARGMLELQHAASVAAVEHDPDSCNQGRRCFVSASCPLFTGPLKGENTMSEIKLRTRKKVAVNPPTEGEIPTAPTPEQIDALGVALCTPTVEEARELLAPAVASTVDVVSAMTGGTPLSALEEIRRARAEFASLCRAHGYDVRIEVVVSV